MKNSKRSILSSKGFTLVELLVVISIIAMLLAILIPSLNKAKEVANRIICGNHTKDLCLANATYANSYDGAFCPMYFLDPNTRGSVGMGGRNYDGRQWMGNRTFRQCLKYDSYAKDKKNPPPDGVSGGYTGPTNMPKSLLCPSDKVSIDWNNNYGGVLTSYSYNLTDWSVPGAWDRMFALNIYMGHKADTIRSPSAKLVFIDGIDWWTAWGPRNADYRNWDQVGHKSIAFYRSGQPVYSYGPVMYRHSEGAVVGFYDAHTEYMKKQQVFVKEDYYDRAGNPLPAGSRKPGMWVADMPVYLLNQGR